MKNLVIILLVAVSYITFAQETARISFKTGDTEIDTHLNDVNGYAAADINVFREDLTIKFKATKSEMDRYLVKEKIRPADVYYGYVLSRTSGKPFETVMKKYKEKKGWGSIAKELGIKPGSEQFHALKNNTLRYIDRERIQTKKNKNIKDDNKKNKKVTDDKIKKSGNVKDNSGIKKNK